MERKPFAPLSPKAKAKLAQAPPPYYMNWRPADPVLRAGQNPGQSCIQPETGVALLAMAIALDVI